MPMDVGMMKQRILASFSRLVHYIAGDSRSSSSTPGRSKVMNSLPEAGGNLFYPLKPELLAQGESFVREVRGSTEVDPVSRVQEVLRRFWKRSNAPTWPDRSQSQRLLVTYTDLEPDGIMAVAELWAWMWENRNTTGIPLLIHHADFANKDRGTLLEKKQLLAQLILGLSKFYTLTREGDDGTDVSKLDKAQHPQQKALVNMRSAYLDAICEELESFKGQLIDFYIMAPGAGNLGAIVKRLKERQTWPLPAKWKVSTCSDSSNMKGMSREDIDALREIMTTCAEGPMTDVSRLSFFGGKDKHPWTESLASFAMPSFASDVGARAPMVAAMLKLFNDEVNASLIDPRDILKVDTVWTPAEQETWTAIRGFYDVRDPSRLQGYCQRLLGNERILSKIEGAYLPTIKAFAYGACDSPLSEQLLFLHQWLEQSRPAFLTYEEGFWHYDAAKDSVQILPTSDGHPQAFRVRRPKIVSPRHEEHLLEMRHTLQDYFLRHLFTLACHISKVHGRMAFCIDDEVHEQAQALVKKACEQKDGENPVDAFMSSVPPTDWRPLPDHRQSSKRLMVAYSDLEPDDLMSISQIWEWKAEANELDGGPLVIFAVDFKGKEGGQVLEKKYMLAAMMMGVPSLYVLTPESDTTGQQVNKNSKTVNPRNLWHQQNRKAEIDRICQELVQFKGEVIDFFIIAPGFGNLGAIVETLKAKGQWPLPSKPTWRVSIYSGAYNIGKMTESDFEAMSDIMKCSDTPLVDMSKFLFFGGADYHPWTDALTTFASPYLAAEISTKYPLLGATLVSFNNEFNAGLVNPHSSDFFAKKPLTEEEASRYEKYKAGFVYGKDETVQEFCKSVVEDAEIIKKLPEYKKSTFRAFAYGGCDSPLCDQLIFLYEYLKTCNPDALNIESGLWFCTNESKHSELRKDEGRFPAIRPTLKDPHDEVCLAELRRALDKYLLQHLDVIKSRAEAAGHA